MRYSLRSRKDKLPVSAEQPPAKIVKTTKITKTTAKVKAKDQTSHDSKELIKKVQMKHIIRPSLPISDAKQRLIRELSFVQGKPSEIKGKSKTKKKLVLHKIDLKGSGKIHKSSQMDGKHLSKILLGKVQQLNSDITPSIAKARDHASPAKLAIQTEILKRAVLKEIRQAADKSKKSAAKSPIKSPLKGR